MRDHERNVCQGGQSWVEAIESKRLSHGQALWVLTQLGFSAGVSAGTFNYYIKSLRKLGVPFRRGETGLSSGRLAQYSFDHLMELSVALSLRTYAILPDLVVGGLIRYRDQLYGYYRKAYLESDCDLGAPIAVAGRSQYKLAMRGIYLDLRLTYSAGQLYAIGPPQLLTPFEALEWFAHTEPPARAHPPLNLSQTTDRVSDLMGRAPPIRRGPRPGYLGPQQV